MAGTPLQMGTGVGAGMHASNRHTDAYMAQMYSALEDMGVNTADDKYKESVDNACSTLGAYPGQPAEQRGSDAPLPPGAAEGSRLAADAAFKMLPSGGWAQGPLSGNGRMANRRYPADLSCDSFPHISIKYPSDLLQISCRYLADLMHISAHLMQSSCR